MMHDLTTGPAIAAATHSCWALLFATGLVAQTPMQFVDATPTNFPFSFADRAIAADLDNDGDRDLLIARIVSFSGPPEAEWLLRNDGGGRLVDVSATQLLPDGVTSRQLVAIDMEGDGDLDLFLGKVGLSRLWRNDGNGVFSDASANLPAINLGPSALSGADFDNDGDVDIAIGGYLTISGQNRMLVNDGTGVFTAIAPFPGSSTNSLATADVDGDGDEDILLSDFQGLRLLRNDGAMTFTDVTSQQLPPGPLTAKALAFADIDADGDQDFVITAGAFGGSNRLLLNDGAGSFSLSANTLSPMPGDTESATFADADADGDLDLFRGSADTLALALNDGSGAFTDASMRLPVFGTVGFPQRLNLTVADLDGDGDVDLFVGAPVTPRILINRHRHVDAGPAEIGQPWTVEVWSQPGYATSPRVCLLAVGLVRLAQPLQLAGLGALWLDPAGPLTLQASLLPTTASSQAFSFAVPLLPALVGIELQTQALIEETFGTGDLRLTTYDAVTIQ